MDLRKIKKLIELLEDSALVEMEITEGENTIRLGSTDRSISTTLSRMDHLITQFQRKDIARFYCRSKPEHGILLIPGNSS